MTSEFYLLCLSDSPEFSILNRYYYCSWKMNIWGFKFPWKAKEKGKKQRSEEYILCSRSLTDMLTQPSYWPSWLSVRIWQIRKQAERWSNLLQITQLVMLGARTTSGWVRSPDSFHVWVHTHTYLLLLFSHSVSSDSLRARGLQHTRLPCPSPSPGICSDSCPLSQWCHSNHLTLCHPLLLPSIFPNIRAFSNESALRIRWPKYWSFNFSISPSNEYSGLISFWIDWLDLLAVQGTLKSLL